MLVNFFWVSQLILKIHAWAVPKMPLFGENGDIWPRYQSSKLKSRFLGTLFSRLTFFKVRRGPCLEIVWLTPVNSSYSEIERGIAWRGLGEAEKGESDQVWMDRRGLRKYWSDHSEDNNYSLISQMRCLLNIWGVMLFLRLTWVIGQCGIGKCHQELLCLTIGHFVEWRAGAPRAWFSCQ